VQASLDYKQRLQQLFSPEGADRADAYLRFLTAAEALLRRRVDVIELGAVCNPYLRRGIEESRELVYAA
jgi:hypothetical protein